MKTKIILLSALMLAIIVSCGPKTAAAVKATADSTALAKTPEYKKMIVAKIFAKPGKENDFIKAARIMIDSTVREPGCESYQLYQDPYEKTNLIFVETYKNQAAVDAHFASSYFKGFGPKINELVAKPGEIKIYDIAGVK